MSAADETPSAPLVTIINDFNGVAGLVVDAQGGAPDPDPSHLPSVADALATTAKKLLEMREALLEVPNIGDWLMSVYGGGVNPGLVQLFPNGQRLRSPEMRHASAAMLMGWLEGEWMRHMHTARAAKVSIGGHECILVLHCVDGLVIKEPASAAD